MMKAPENTADCKNILALATPIRAARQQMRTRDVTLESRAELSHPHYHQLHRQSMLERDVANQGATESLLMSLDLMVLLDR